MLSLLICTETTESCRLLLKVILVLFVNVNNNSDTECIFFSPLDGHILVSSFQNFDRKCHKSPCFCRSLALFYVFVYLLISAMKTTFYKSLTKCSWFLYTELATANLYYVSYLLLVADCKVIVCLSSWIDWISWLTFITSSRFFVKIHFASITLCCLCIMCCFSFSKHGFLHWFSLLT